MRQRAAGRARFPARLLSPQERRLEGQQAVSAAIAGPRANWRRCRPTTSWISPRTWPRRWRRRCRPPPRSRPCRWLPDSELAFYSAEYAAHRLPGRAAMVSLRHLAARSRAELANLLRPHASTCRPASSRASRTGAPTSAPASSKRCRRRACTRMIGCHLVDGAGHWVQQEQPAAGQPAAGASSCKRLRERRRKRRLATTVALTSQRERLLSSFRTDSKS